MSQWWHHAYDMHTHILTHQDTAELLTTYAYSWKEGDDFCLCYTMDTGAFVPLSLLLCHFSCVFVG